MRELYIDIETFSETNIKTAGAYKYAETAEILLFAYSFDYGEIKGVDLTAGEVLPDEVWDALTDRNVRKTAHNAPFELEVISTYFNIKLDANQWRCSSVLCAVAGYPMSLDEASKALGTTEKKDAEGKSLIRFFCMPCKPSKVNGGRTRNLPEHDLVKWNRFIKYYRQDVATGQAICKKLAWVEFPENEHKLWVLDQKINKRGWKVDIDLAKNAIAIDDIIRERLTKEVKQITGLSNPNSVIQLGAWLIEKGLEIPLTDKGTPSLIKEVVLERLSMLKSGELDMIVDDVDLVIRALEIRQEISKTSIKKYTSMIAAAGKGDRVRGLFQFCGAGRTWRWAGRLVQVQNLPRILMDGDLLMIARELVKQGDIENLEWNFGSVSDTLSQLIRTAFIPEEGKRLIISDYSAIEARVLAWIADEDWVLEVFRTHGKIYEATAARMFHINIEDVTKEERQKGKVGTLLLGFQGGPDALDRMNAEQMGIRKKEYLPIVRGWREANPNIVKFWYACENGAKQAIKTGSRISVGNRGIYFSMKNGALLLTLPSCRSLMFPDARIDPSVILVPVYKTIIDDEGDEVQIVIRRERRESEQITFMAVDQYTRKWSRSSTYGGKLTENICQAIARDCLGNGLLNMDAVGIDISSHVHDEAIPEMPLNVSSLREVIGLMTKLAPWMEGLPLTAAGDESFYYNK